ncbi:hypothetical protein LWC05_14915 [Acetobacter sicerae]|uniref:Uncharacterized protein n=1 Tax=Acetobacter sicerae TaxID=85325 RepID=A0ABS8VW13_9PROT|nr:hypothetical protein [Acetobacter sicerae]MCE0745165.1 hypothetical protein [Acetobacter sicerae]
MTVLLIQDVEKHNNSLALRSPYGEPERCVPAPALMALRLTLSCHEVKQRTRDDW